MGKIATIGFFDGVHKGHQYLFRQLDRLAAERGLSPLIVTFEQHPRTVLQSGYIPKLLTTTDERREMLNAYGEVLMLSFASIHMLTAAKFMELLHTQYGVSVLLMGYDHRFGSDQLQQAQDYHRLGEQLGIEVLTMQEFSEGEGHISSTEIRMALENGNITVANDLLGHPYSIRGTVVHGKGIGRTIGFPTANIQPLDSGIIIPKAGVYAVQVCTDAFEWTDAMLNIDHHSVIEVHIPSYQGDLYDRTMDIRFLRFVREEKQMDSLDSLQKQIQEDLNTICQSSS